MQYKHTMHLLHLVLTILFFPWAIIWAYRILANNSHNKELDKQAQQWQHEELLRELREYRKLHNGMDT